MHESRDPQSKLNLTSSQLRLIDKSLKIIEDLKEKLLRLERLVEKKIK